MNDNLDRIIDRKRRSRMSDEKRGGAFMEEDVTSLERISVYLELINHAYARAQTLAGMAGTTLGVFFAAFTAAFVAESGSESVLLKVADLISEALFVIGAVLLLRCIFQSLHLNTIHDAWNEDELSVHWQAIDRRQEYAARRFWVGTVMLALSIGILIAADVVIDLGIVPAK